MTKMITRLVGVAIAASCALGGAVALPDSSAGAAATGIRVTGSGQRNHQFLAFDVTFVNGETSGVVTMGYVNGSEVCTYTSFPAGSVTGPDVYIKATGTCTAHTQGYSHAAAYHRFSIINVPGGHDSIDVNALPGSPSGFAIPGGPVTVGNYYITAGVS